MKVNRLLINNELNSNIFHNLILELINIVEMHNHEIKRGNFENVVNLSDEKISLWLISYPHLSEMVFTDQNYGLNLKLFGFTSYLFPLFLYQNSFRLEIIKRIRNFMSKDYSFNELNLYMYKISIFTFRVKKGGFSITNYEIIRFYYTYFDKIVDDDYQKFLKYIHTYKSKYIKISKPIIQKKFYITQKFSTYFLIPNFNHLGLNAVMFHHTEDVDDLFSEFQSHPLGLLFDNDKQKKFSLFFSPYDRNLKSNTIEKISFFENLDLFHEDNHLKKLVNYSNNILELYYEYEDNNFQNTAVNFDMDFFTNKFFYPQTTDLDILIHLFNTRRLPLNHQIHPVSQYYFSYRNKLVNFYGTTNYFIYIFQPDGKIIPSNVDLFVTLLKNTFPNGYVIQSRSAFLISTFLFKKDFEKIQSSFIDFFLLFNLKVRIFENLNLISFSFYQIPNSTYFDRNTYKWNFPIFQEKDVSELIHYQIDNLNAEKASLNNPDFASRVTNYLATWKTEIASLSESLENNKPD